MRRRANVIRRLAAVPMAALCLTCITTEGLTYGLDKRPDSARLHEATAEFLQRIDVLPWNQTTAERYGGVQTALERLGETPAPLDLPIAAHALTIDAVLVTNGRAFRQVVGLRIEEWLAG